MLDWVWFALNTSSRGYEIVQALSCIQKCAGKGGKGGGGFGYPLDLCMVVNIKLKNLYSNTTMGQVVECILTEVIRMGRQPTWYQSHHPSRPDCNIETLTLAPYNKYAWGEERFLSTYVRHREVSAPSASSSYSPTRFCDLTPATPLETIPNHMIPPGNHSFPSG